jgi:hypothetical protein
MRKIILTACIASFFGSFLGFLLFSTNAVEAKESIVPPNFFSSWNPGIPGGVPNVTTVFKTINASDYGNGAKSAASAINAAIQAAGDVATPANRQVVQLSEGVFLIDETIKMNRSNVVLRGVGIGKTFLRGVHYGSAITIGGTPIHYYATQAEFPITFSAGVPESQYWVDTNLTDVTKDVKKNDTSIEVADASLFKPGDILKLDRIADAEADPNGNSFGKDGIGTEWRLDLTYILRVKGSKPSSTGPPSEEYRPVAQYVEVASVKGNTLMLTNKVNIDYPVALRPQVWDTHAHNFKYIGVENMTVQGKADNHYTSLTPMTRASSYSWLKNIECDGKYPGWKGRHIEMYGFRNVVRDSYIHDSNDNAPGGTGYGICVSGTDGLIENNIVIRFCKCIQGVVSGGGNVIAYNYVPDSETVPEHWQETVISGSHGSYSHSDLYEGNFTANLSTDATHGNNGMIVFFRNHAWGRNKDGKTSSNLRALEVSGWNREHASIGNVLLSPDLLPNSCLWSVPATVVLSDGAKGQTNFDKMAVYRMGTNTWKLGHGSNTLGYESMDDGQAYRMFHRHLDFNYVEKAVYDNPDNPVKTLPNSLYLDSKPAFFGNLVWPPVNPFGSTHETRVMTLPAAVRYENEFNK